jgi:alpha 1,3-glucosidase
LFAFGYQQSKLGYETQHEVEQIIENFENRSIGYDVLWLDLLHLKGHAPWEYDHKNFPKPSHFVEHLDRNKRHVCRSCDCHLPIWEDHIQYQEAKKGGYFIRLANGKDDWVATCWPGNSSWPDYLSLEVTKWYISIHAYNYGRDYSMPNTWFWNDMNEPVTLGTSMERTFTKDCRHLNGLEVRETKSLYGLLQSAGTYQGMRERDGKAGYTPQRVWFVSRSWWAGSGKYTWVWTGDNSAKWDHLAESLSMMTTAGLNGMPFTGEDLGGFRWYPSPELMVRFYHVGCWIYPLYRNHCWGGQDREPWHYTGESYIQICDAIRQRYTLIGIWYTHSMYATKSCRSPVVPLWLEWPEVPALHDYDREVLFADTFLVAPVLADKASSVTIVKPPGVWYSYWSGNLVKDGEQVPVTMWDVPVYIRGGRIAPLYNSPGLTTLSTIVKPLTLIVAGDEKGESEGFLYLDDGITYDYETGVYVHRKFTLKGGILKSSKADALEVRVPYFLQDCIIFNITVYQVQEDQSVIVTYVSGLSLKLADEWSYDLRNATSVGSRREVLIGKKRGSSAVSIGLGVVITVAVLAFGFALFRWNRKARLVDEDPMVSSGGISHYMSAE